ncbi:Glyceraldehyde-3-phosphate dehydrogenase 1 [Candidatus Fokinia solitaria]|uniref:Glyceraldehyde-3-phosphate dehydrogenase 1 n=1 Tax=Candidatus Fokinia solitaria TaxID=1802984 RepID=A0A2U8BSX8_9RICK|nr:glyceraldehyde 3-phosphate dehydrogenase NAD-binding domain-containing protein [Candidatus Fokinia solitaria]AWD33449.1 Glyceraldehyde-3-phosphate dehydrogenase 1 [Candidatus Fokinia solitaria]
MKVCINGFGRIGRSVLRSFLDADAGYREYFDIVRINGRTLSAKDAAYALKYDSTHGVLNIPVQCIDDGLFFPTINKRIEVTAYENVEILSDTLNGDIELVLECSGAFNKKSLLQPYFLKGGVTNVIVSAPCEKAEHAIILGVNNDRIEEVKKGHIVTLGSCTTNCILPAIKAINDKFEITAGFVTTVHAYTNDQALLDKSHKDKRRGRAANLSIIPSKTGFTGMISELFPKLGDKIGGASLRVPVANVSTVDFRFSANCKLSVELLLDCITDYANTYADIMALNSEELVSCDFNGCKHSCIFDATQSFVNDNNARIVCWYDNEIGFSNRMLDLCKMLTVHYKTIA